jgi:hypothetical protein
VQVGFLRAMQRELIGGPPEVVLGRLRAIPARIVARRRGADKLRCDAAAEPGEDEREHDDELHAAMVRTPSCGRLALALRRVNRYI